MGVEALGDGLGDDGQLIGFQLLDHFLLPGNDGVNLATLAVEVVGDAFLNRNIWCGNNEISKILGR